MVKIQQKSYYFLASDAKKYNKKVDILYNKNAYNIVVARQLVIFKVCSTGEPN